MNHKTFVTVYPTRDIVLDSTKRFRRTLSKEFTTKTMKNVGEKFRQQVNRYIPVGDTHNLQKKSYTLTTGKTRREGPWFKLEYHNTPEVPYAMYQYYGEVWGPNYAKWQADLKLTKDPNDANIKWSHVGWVSEKGKKKRPMGYPLGVKRTFVMKNGKILSIAGYKKKKPKPKPFWLEYYRNSNRFDVWLKGTAQSLIANALREYKAQKGK